MNDSWSRVVRNPNSQRLKEIRRLLGDNPRITKAEIARKLRVTRTTVYNDLRWMNSNMQSEAAKDLVLKRREAISHLDLVDRISSTAKEIETEIDKLKAKSTSLATSRTLFIGYGILERYLRLLAELVGQMPTQNVYIEKLQALMNVPLEPSSVPCDLRECLEALVGPSGDK